MSELKTPRRFYLRKRTYWRDSAVSILESAFRAKQEAQPGTALPSTFPYLSKLSVYTAGYTTVQDLDGADVDELTRAGLTIREARIVLAALQPLLP